MNRESKFECKREHLTIRGRIFGDVSSRKPVVILCHGFLANQKMCRRYARLLAEIGYIAVTFDFCGGSIRNKSDGKSVDITVFTEVSDLLAVMDHISQQPFTQDISLLGCSQGGLVCAMVADQFPQKVRSLTLLYPALCIPDDARKGKMMFFRFDPSNIPDILGRFPMKLGGDYARTVISLDPYDVIGKYQGPVLYLHGTEDEIVDITYARKAKDLYAHCEYHEIIGAGHTFKGKYDEEARSYIREFYKDKK